MLISAATAFTPSPPVAGATPKRLSIFRNGNAMCENYEVSEVLGLAEEGTKVTVLLVLWNNLVRSSHF